MKKKITILLSIFILSIGCQKKEPYNQNGIYFGFNTNSENISKSLDKIKKESGKNHPHIITIIKDWENEFPKTEIKEILLSGSIPLIFWEPWVWKETDSITAASILNGLWDEYIRSWAKKSFDLEYPIMIACAAYPTRTGLAWSVDNENSIVMYNQMLRYIHDIFKKENANNIIWVWIQDYEKINSEYKQSMKLYPGNQYIDWIGLSFANEPTDKWTFNYSKHIKKINNITKNKPILIEIKHNSLEKIIQNYENNIYKKPNISAILIQKDETEQTKQLKDFNSNIFNTDLEKINKLHLKD